MEKVLEAAKLVLATMPGDFYGIGYQDARQALAKAVSEAE